MASLIITFGHPSDPEAFEDYYANQHLPLAAETMPNLTGAESFRVIGPATRTRAVHGSEVYRIERLTYPSVESLREGVGSAAGKEVLADLDRFADGGWRALICEEDEGEGPGRVRRDESGSKGG